MIKSINRKLFEAIFKVVFTLNVMLSMSACTKDVNIPTKPNFVFILVDDQGWEQTSVEMIKGKPQTKSDYYHTPNLERLAEQGMRFTNGYAPAAVCAPTRYSIQFGQTTARLRMTKVGMPTAHIDHSMLSIPKLLKSVDSNYRAAHYGKWHLDIEPSVLGYDDSDGMTRNADGGYGENDKWGNNFDEDPKKIFSLTKKASDFMEASVNIHKPFYLQISHYAVHAVLFSRHETFEKYDSLPKGKIHDLPIFAAMTENLDTGVGMIMKKIEELGIADNTYIIYMSDNGGVPTIPKRIEYIIGDNFPLRRGKWDLFEGGIRVPFIIKGPGIKENSQSNVPVIGYDLLPTLRDLAGGSCPLPETIDGGSFKDILLNEGEGNIKRPFGGLIFHFPHTHGRILDQYPSAIRVGDYKLVKFRYPDSTRLMLFDLSNDIGESENLTDMLPAKAKELEKEMDDYLISVDANIPFKSNLKE